MACKSARSPTASTASPAIPRLSSRRWSRSGWEKRSSCRTTAKRWQERPPCPHLDGAGEGADGAGERLGRLAHRRLPPARLRRDLELTRDAVDAAAEGELH